MKRQWKPSAATVAAIASLLSLGVGMSAAAGDFDNVEIAASGVKTAQRQRAIPQKPESQNAAGVEDQSGVGSHRLNLADFKGDTFLEFMTASNGVKAALDSDYKGSFTIVDGETLRRRVSLFAPAVVQKAAKLFNDPDGLYRLADKMAGQTSTPETIQNDIVRAMQGLVPTSKPPIFYAQRISPILAIASGAGVQVNIDDNNFYDNIGYASGNSANGVERDVKTGRSFGDSGARKLSDVSDREYLAELGEYMGQATDAKAFYRELFQVLTQCDASSYGELSPAAQGVATDFLAVYTAELDRNIMTGFQAHSWQVDLAEVTLVAPYVARTGMLFSQEIGQDGKIDKTSPITFGKGDMTAFTAQGATGGGIGETRRSRKKLQAMITLAEKELHPDLVSKIETLVGAQGGDVIDELVTFLNSPDNNGAMKQNSAAIADAISEFEAAVSDDADRITEYSSQMQ